tara:strand:+ start:472 stop:741 length:270 start_codon:yes stop_codon:yes gene_type:complete
MSKTLLRSKPISVRPGYPLSSEEINQGFDNLIYDLCTILGTKFPGWKDTPYSTFITHMKSYSEQVNMNLLEEGIVDDTEKGYTKVWRTI